MRPCAAPGASGQWICLAHPVFKPVVATRGVVENSLMVLRLVESQHPTPRHVPGAHTTDGGFLM